MSFLSLPLHLLIYTSVSWHDNYSSGINRKTYIRWKRWILHPVIETIERSFPCSGTFFLCFESIGYRHSVLLTPSKRQQNSTTFSLLFLSIIIKKITTNSNPLLPPIIPQIYGIEIETCQTPHTQTERYNSKIFKMVKKLWWHIFLRQFTKSRQPNLTQTNNSACIHRIICVFWYIETKQQPTPTNTAQGGSKSTELESASNTSTQPHGLNLTNQIPGWS